MADLPGLPELLAGANKEKPRRMKGQRHAPEAKIRILLKRDWSVAELIWDRAGSGSLGIFVELYHKAHTIGERQILT